MGRRAPPALLLERAFELDENLYLVLQQVSSLKELFLLRPVKLVHLVELVVQASEELVRRVVRFRELLRQFGLVHVLVANRGCEFLVNLRKQTCTC